MPIRDHFNIIFQQNYMRKFSVLWKRVRCTKYYEIYVIIAQTRLRHKCESVIWQSVPRMNNRASKNTDDWGMYCVACEYLSSELYNVTFDRSYAVIRGNSWLASKSSVNAGGWLDYFASFYKSILKIPLFPQGRM